MPLLKVAKQQKDAVLFIEISGVVDETSAFEQLGPIQVSALRIRCMGVTRINSAGVRLWIKYFQDLKSRNMQITLVDCASVLVEQMNIIVNFAAGMAVESIMMPYSCSKCGECFQVAGKVSDIKAKNYEIQAEKCPKCGSSGSFDDLPDEYFHFMMRK